MKQINMIISIFFFALFSMCGIAAYAAEYTIDFTRDEAYEAIMNTTPEQAERRYGGEVSYYAALTDDDKEALFEMMWNALTSGILYNTVHTIEIDTFADDYFSSIISAFRQTKSDEEGLENLRNNIDEINAEYFSEGVQSNIEIVTQTEPSETMTSIVTAPSVDADADYETDITSIMTTTTQIADAPSGSHTMLIVILSGIAIACVAVGILLYYKKSQ